MIFLKTGISNYHYVIKDVYMNLHVIQNTLIFQCTATITTANHITMVTCTNRAAVIPARADQTARAQGARGWRCVSSP